MRIAILAVHAICTYSGAAESCLPTTTLASTKSCSPAHNYTFPFEPNPNWSSFYAYAPEIKQYFVDFANKYDLMPYVQLNTKVVSAVWDEEKGTCEFRLDIVARCSRKSSA
jgi:cation diffusion facilitator CzcD-associated flavoprotein CzcO